MKQLAHCRKAYTDDQDKALHPEETVRLIKKRFGRHGETILQDSKRIDTGRLGIPVFLSVCGSQAREIMPTRKQMGKGASPAQAEASALMELAERYSLFSFLEPANGFQELTWSQAEACFGQDLLPLETMLDSVHDDIDPAQARTMLDLVSWRFCPATRPGRSRPVHVPVDWFFTLNEFNGSSAGNTFEEAVLQSGCELVERHVCALIDRDRPTLPTISVHEVHDPVLQALLEAFSRQGVHLVLKDFSLNTGVPTVGAMAYDPSTFPVKSEIVFTAGTATSPVKAAIRALTEVAQLAGDFETGSCYDPSGLGKLTSMEECRWLESGPEISLSDLPDISHEDFLTEIESLQNRLADVGTSLYSIDTTHPELHIPACYSFVPGFLFRERTSRASLGLFIGRILTEQCSLAEAEHGLSVLEELQPKAPYVPFFKGLIQLRSGDLQSARQAFDQAEAVQPSAEERGLASFYTAYTLSQMGQWQASLPYLDRAIELCPDVHAYYNLRGVARFKLQAYTEAAKDFDRALSIDAGSAIDLANLGLCYRHLGNRGEAVSCLETSLELDPSLDFARSALQELTG